MAKTSAMTGAAQCASTQVSSNNDANNNPKISSAANDRASAPTAARSAESPTPSFEKIPSRAAHFNARVQEVMRQVDVVGFVGVGKMAGGGEQVEKK